MLAWFLARHRFINPLIVMPVYWFALLICVLASASSTLDATVIERPLLSAFGLIMLFGLLSKALALIHAKRVLSGRMPYELAARRLSDQLHGLRWVWLFPGAVGLTAMGLSQQIDETMFGRSMAASAALLLVPSLLAIATTWIAERQFDDWVGEQLEESADTEQSFQLPVIQAIVHAFRLQAAWIIAPVLIVLAVIDLTNLGLSHLPFRQDWIGGAVGLLCLPLILPKLISSVWPTSDCDKDDKTAWICELVRVTGYRGFHVRRWETGGRICSAMVAGFVPGFRVLLLSDAILNRLDRIATTMVVLHELAHIARWHIAMRMLTLLPTWSIAALVSSRFADTSTEHAACVGGGLLVTMLVLRRVCHATEIDADQYACHMSARLAEQSSGCRFDDAIPRTKQQAAAVLANALRSVSGDRAKADRSGWMHPSLTFRLDKLRVIANSSDEDPDVFGRLLPATESVE